MIRRTRSKFRGVKLLRVLGVVCGLWVGPVLVKWRNPSPDQARRWLDALSSRAGASDD
jgi:hypothetical protein